MPSINVSLFFSTPTEVMLKKERYPARFFNSVVVALFQWNAINFHVFVQNFEND